MIRAIVLSIVSCRASYWYINAALKIFLFALGCCRLWILRVSLPFSRLRLHGPRPRVVPRGYPFTPGTLGQRIRQRRMNLGLTQRTLALRLSCWYQSVASWERDESIPLAARWPTIEAVLGPG